MQEIKHDTGMVIRFTAQDALREWKARPTRLHPTRPIISAFSVVSVALSNAVSCCRVSVYPQVENLPPLQCAAADNWSKSHATRLAAGSIKARSLLRSHPSTASRAIPRAQPAAGKLPRALLKATCRSSMRRLWPAVRAARPAAVR